MHSAHSTSTQTHAAEKPSPLYLVLPCYNEAEALPQTLKTLQALVPKLQAEFSAHFSAVRLLFVDDGSTDATWEVLSAAQAAHSSVCALKLSRNCGHQNALLAGLHAAHTAGAKTTITLDADLQDDPEATLPMLRAHVGEKENAPADIVYAARNNRATDSFLKRNTAHAFYKLMRALGVDLLPHHADYRLLSRRALTTLLQYREVNLFLRGTVRSLGFSTATVYYSRCARTAGSTKYPPRKMIALAAAAITSFSITPLRLITLIGMLVMLGTILLSAWVLLQWTRGHVVPGWASTVLPLYFLGGIQTFSIGILGEYLGRTYMETKARPRYIVEEHIGL